METKKTQKMKHLINTLALLFVSQLVLAQTTTKNYVKNVSPQLPVQTETAVDNLAADHKIESITYFDGLGRKYTLTSSLYHY